MKTKKTPATLSRPLDSKPNKSRKKVLIAIIWLLILLVIGYLVSTRSLSDSATPATGSPSSAAEQTAALQAASISEKDTFDNGVNSSNNSGELDESAGISATKMSEAEAILNAPLPETDSLAKEEINRLEDESLRLAEQEESAAEQVTMNQQLTDMKAEQIELLEQQIAQLEAKASGISTKNTAP